MILKILFLTSAAMICEGMLPDRLLFQRTPQRFLLNSQGVRRPAINWSYQVVNGRPVISGFPNPEAFVSFGLNPQTGQIEQTQIITQTRPGGPVTNMFQNMLHVAGQFFGQVTGALGSAFGGALQTAGQFGQDIQDLTKPVVTITDISHSALGKEPAKQPVQQPVQPSSEQASQPPTSQPESSPDQPRSEPAPAIRIIDQAIASLQNLRNNIRTYFQNHPEGERGENALDEINESVDLALKTLKALKVSASNDSVAALQLAQKAVNTALNNAEAALVGVAGTQAADFVETTRKELESAFAGNPRTESFSVTN